MRFFKNHFLIFLFFSMIVFSSCDFRIMKAPIIDLSENFYWTQVDENISPENLQSMEKLQFEKLTTMGYRNLEKLVGPFGNYIILKAEFTVPEELKQEHLSLFIKYLHFSEAAWINGHYIGKYGQFPPYEKSPMYISHTYKLPEEFLLDDINTLYIKVWCHGRAEISKKVFIGTEDRVNFNNTSATFYNSIQYTLYVGLYFVIAVLYLVMFLHNRRRREYISIALTSYFSMQFTFILFIQHMPFYAFANSQLLTLYLYKGLACISAYLVAFFIVSFIIYFLGGSQSKKVLSIRISMLAIQCLITWSVQSYNTLIKICPYMIVTSVCQFIFIFPQLKKSAKTDKTGIKILSIGFAILAVTITIDHTLRHLLHLSGIPFVSFYGWLLLNVFYISILCIRFSKIFKQNAYLTENLKIEVENQTKQIRATNKLLEDELEKSNRDLNMAAIVQQRLFNGPTRNFIGWDFGFCYKPLSKVSGDLFDFYNIGNILDGISLFDVSGHGIASSLITMLSKNIIYNSFRQTRFYKLQMSEIMKDINKKITEAKGKVDNYLTGIILHLSPIQDEVCTLQLANAGHPYPFLYSKEKDEIISLKTNPKLNYGAIGLNGDNLSCVDINFTMKTGDFLVLFTDGLTEAQNINGEQFGRERAKQILMQNKHLGAQQIVNKLTQSLKQYTDIKPAEDDLTIIVIKRENSEDYLEALSDDE